MTEVPAASRLLVRRLRCEYLVSSRHPRPERLQGRLDDAVARSLGPALAVTLEARLPASDPGIWLIRRMDLDLAVNADWQPEQVARAWTGRVAQSLDMAMRAGDEEKVVWFADRAAYLARFVSDLAAGQAWSRWYYEDFAGLRPLTASAASRTALLDRPDVGLSALAELPGDRLAALLRVLTAQDARLLLDGLAAGPPGGDQAENLAAVWAARRGPAGDLLAGDEEPHAALRLFLAAHAGRPALPLGGLRTAALALVRLARLVVGQAGASRLLAALSTGSMTALYTAAGAGDAEVLQPLLAAPGEWLSAVARELTGRSAAAEPTGNSGPRPTPFGGIFLLLPLLDEFPLAEAMRGWPDLALDNTGEPRPGMERGGDPGTSGRGEHEVRPQTGEHEVGPPTGEHKVGPQTGEHKVGPQTGEHKVRPYEDFLDTEQHPGGAALARLLILARCCGAGRAAAALADPLLRELAGIPPNLPAADAAAWLRRVTPAQAGRFLATLAEWRRARGDVPATNYILQRVPARGRPVAVLLDGYRGAWLYAGSTDPARPAILAEQLRAVLPQEGGETVLFCSGGLAQTLSPALSGARLESLSGPPVEAAAAGDAALAEVLARLPQLAADLGHLALPPSWRGPRHVDLALAAAAQALLRDLSWRLPGFARSGLPYLHANFLDFGGTVEDEAERRVVRLGRPPLHLVLQMTGPARRTYRLSWLDERQFALYGED